MFCLDDLTAASRLVRRVTEARGGPEALVPGADWWPVVLLHWIHHPHLDAGLARWMAAAAERERGAVVGAEGELEALRAYRALAGLEPVLPEVVSVVLGRPQAIRDEAAALAERAAGASLPAGA